MKGKSQILAVKVEMAMSNPLSQAVADAFVNHVDSSAFEILGERRKEQHEHLTSIISCRYREEDVQHGTLITSAHSHQKALPNYTAGQVLSVTGSAGSENIRQPRRSEYIVRLKQLFQPVFPASNSDVSAVQRYFFRIACVVNLSWAYALAFFNRCEKMPCKTRGFTSCYVFLILDEMRT